jgi:hypothetical protein
MLFGHAAGRHTEDLDLDALKGYLSGGPVTLKARRIPVSNASRQGGGAARIVRCAGLAFGRAECEIVETSERLHSRFPRIWAGVNVARRIVSAEEEKA